MKKEIQDKIIENSIDLNSTEEEFYNILKIVSPGTNFRSAIDGALRMKRGALIAIENENLPEIIEGGFKLNTRFTPQRLMELCKMDGAIVLSKDLKKINYANALLAPNHSIKSQETGTRHKAAERTAKHTGALVVAISERRDEITIYYKNKRYPLKSSNELLRKVNENIHLLEKQREIFDYEINRLNTLELQSATSLNQAIQTIQKGKVIEKVARENNRHILELGKEGELLKLRIKEIITNVDKETDLVIKDYTKINQKKSVQLIDDMPYENLLQKENVSKCLGYEEETEIEPVKGWRILSKTSLHEEAMARIIKEFGSLQSILLSNATIYGHVLEEEKANALQTEIEKFKIGEF